MANKSSAYILSSYPLNICRSYYMKTVSNGADVWARIMIGIRHILTNTDEYSDSPEQPWRPIMGVPYQIDIFWYVISRTLSPASTIDLNVWIFWMHVTTLHEALRLSNIEKEGASPVRCNVMTNSEITFLSNSVGGEECTGGATSQKSLWIMSRKHFTV